MGRDTLSLTRHALKARSAAFPPPAGWATQWPHAPAHRRKQRPKLSPLQALLGHEQLITEPRNQRLAPAPGCSALPGSDLGEGQFALRSSALGTERERVSPAEGRMVLILNFINRLFLDPLLDYLLPGRARLWLTQQPSFLVTVRKWELQESLAQAEGRATPRAMEEKEI